MYNRDLDRLTDYPFDRLRTLQRLRSSLILVHALLVLLPIMYIIFEAFAMMDRDTTAPAERPSTRAAR